MSRDEQPIVVVQHVRALAGSEPVRLELFEIVDIGRRREAEDDFANAIGGGWTPEERAVHDELLGAIYETAEHRTDRGPEPTATEVAPPVNDERGHRHI
jgi:hypothetical protein